MSINPMASIEGRSGDAECSRQLNVRLALEDFPAVIREKMRMGLKVGSLRTANASIGIDEAANRVRDAVTCYKHRKIVVDRDQSTIKHPMNCAAQRYAVAHGVRPAISDRSDVGGLDLGAATAVDDFETRNCTGFAIGRLDRYGECRVAERASEQPLDDRPFKG
jgi:hypothetical protein